MSERLTYQQIRDTEWPKLSPLEKALILALELNSQIQSQAEERRQLVEGI